MLTWQLTHKCTIMFSRCTVPQHSSRAVQVQLRFMGMYLVLQVIQINTSTNVMLTLTFITLVPQKKVKLVCAGAESIKDKPSLQ